MQWRIVVAAYWGKLTSHIPSRSSSSSTHWRKAPHSILYIEYEIAHCILQYQAAGTTIHRRKAPHHTGITTHWTTQHSIFYILNHHAAAATTTQYTYCTLCMKLHISKHHTAATTRWTTLHSKLYIVSRRQALQLHALC